MNTKTTKVIFWISTILVAFATMPAIFFINTPQSTEGMKHLGVPIWLAYEISIGKFIGGLILLLPFFPKKLKEWTYVAIGIDVISAFIAKFYIDGFSDTTTFGPIIAFIFLLTSYLTLNKLQSLKEE